uniref:Uncharacterized protein n=1 Tax=Mola mola TaxID=94237 RepID=A0A3Q3XES9_MOLML
MDTNILKKMLHINTLQTFLNSDLYDSNFETSTLEASYPDGKQVRVGCNVGYSGFFKLICEDGIWNKRGKNCEPRFCGHPGDAQFADFHLEKGQDFVFGSKVVYTCQKGYQMVSRVNYRHCMAEGWDGVVPICEAQQCPVIHVKSNVQVNGDLEEATYGNVIRFSCKYSSQYLIGPTELYCDENGDWSGEPPECQEIKCAKPTIDNGYVVGGVVEYNENEVLHYKCNPKYSRSEERIPRCGKVGTRAGWSPTPLCELTKCRLDLPATDRTTYDPPYTNVFLPGETVRVNCDEKSWISNTDTTSVETTCGEDGQWTITPVCKEVVCNRHQENNVRDWHVEWWRQPLRLGDTVRYSCVSGFRSTDGSYSGKCTRSGWTPKPLCSEITCKVKYYADFADIDGVVKSVYKYNEKVHYTCKYGNAGFTLTCWDRGWTGEARCPKCPEAKIENGFVVGPHNGLLYYTCNEGYKLFTGGWWGEAKCDKGVVSGLGECIEESKCGKIPVIPNGEVLARERVDPEDERRITCEQGFVAQVYTLTCRGGQWSSGQFQLNDVSTDSNCGAPPKVDNAVIRSSYKKEYLSNSSVTYLCRDKYKIVDENTLRCQDGEWEKKNITCSNEEKTIIASAEKEQYLNEEVIQYQCAASAESGKATCIDGKWNKTMTCEVKPCELPEDTPNGYYQIIHGEDFVFGTTIKYLGYQMVSRIDTRTCLQDKWTNHVPVCDPPPAEKWVIVRGLPDNDNPILPDSFLRFSCQGPGKFLNGSSVLICGKDGQWDNPFPICEGKPSFHMMNCVLCVQDITCENKQDGWEISVLKTCKVRALPRNVNMIPDIRNRQVREGQKLSFVCKQSGHNVRGMAEIQCLANGQWSHPFPTCGKSLGCRRPPTLANGDIKESVGFEYRHDERVAYTCQALYLLAGDPYKTCLDGKWIGQMKCLSKSK